MDQLRPLANAAGQMPATDAEAASLDFLSPSDQTGVIGRFGPYEIFEEIARGGMGIVLKARDPSLDRIVAIKVLAPALASNPGARLRFLREARAAAAVSHEHVVDIHAVDEANGLPYLVMQFISGKSLRERIRQTGALRLEEILRIGTQIASGLAAAHAQGLIHRDIKPANILLENGVERVKITDFGLARAVDDVSMTQPGSLTGTPEFMAPEQARGEPVDHRADLFSLGCVLYCMATGESPFTGTTLLAVIRRVCDEAARPLQEVNPALPDWFGETVAQLLAKDPANRPQSSHEVAQLPERHLARLQRSPGSALPGGEARPHGERDAVRAPQLQRWTRLRRITAACAGLAVLVGMGLLLGHLATRSSSTVARGAFRVFGTNSEDFKAFAGLAEAVRAAHSRDTIEVATNGPFVLEPVALGDKALTIRSASGARPVFLSQRGAAQMLTTKALLVLEGLEFRVEASETSPPPGQPGFPSLGAVVSSADAPLFVANCRFQTPSQDRPPIACAVDLLNSSYVELRNCEIRTWPGCGVMWEFNAVPAGWDATNAEVRLWVVNCVQLSETTLTVAQRAPVCAAITLQRNTISARVALDLHALVAPPGLSLFADTNVFDCPLFLKQVLRMGAGELKASLRWKESHNFFNLPLVFSGPGPGTNAPNLTELTAWNQCWNQTNTGSAHLRRRRDRPFLSSRAETLTASASEQSSWLGEQIAAAGGDRSIPYGAALELVGPGPAGEPPELHAGIAASRDDG